MNTYELSRLFIDFSFENPSKIKPNHYAIYFFSIEHCNRLGWKKEFGLPTSMVMEATGIKSYNTYIKTFNDLVSFGFFKLIEKSKNQYSSNIIALSKFDKALYKALDKALIKHTTKQSESTRQSIDSINKPIYNKPIYNKPKLEVDDVYTDINNLLKNYLCERRTVLAFCKNQKITPDELELNLKKFNIELSSQGQHAKTEKDYKSHFLNWFRIQEKKKKEKSSAKKESQYGKQTEYFAGRQTKEDIVANIAGWGVNS